MTDGMMDNGKWDGWSPSYQAGIDDGMVAVMNKGFESERGWNDKRFLYPQGFKHWPNLALTNLINHLEMI